MKKLPAIASVLLLAGCATSAPSPEPIVRTVEVKVPVAVPCEAPAIERPTYSFDSAKVEMQLDDKVALLLADRLQREGTERQLRAALEGCRRQ